MPSTRGAHPEDAEQFSTDQVPTLRAAVRDLAWFRTRGYGDSSSLKMVGDRYRLKRRQRNAVARSACGDAERAHRLVRRREPSSLTGRWIDVDGFNVLISVEGMLGGAYLFVGRDRAYRDVDPVQGTYRIVEQTAPALQAVLRAMDDLGVAGLTWWLDAHVSNVGRVKAQLADQAPTALAWEIEIREAVDETLAQSDRVVATSDSAVLDEVDAWCSVEQAVRAHWDVRSNVRDLRPRSDHVRFAADP